EPTALVASPTACSASPSSPQAPSTRARAARPDAAARGRERVRADRGVTATVGPPLRVGCATPALGAGAVARVLDPSGRVGPDVPIVCEWCHNRDVNEMGYSESLGRALGAL